MRQAHTENCRKRIDEELRGTVKAAAAQRRVKECQDNAVGRRTKRTKFEPGGSMDGSANNNEFEQQQQQRGTGVKFVQQWRHRQSRQFRRRQWI